MLAVPELIIIAFVLLSVVAAVVIMLIVIKGRTGKPTSLGGTPAERLEQLEQLQRDGQITQAEYDARRAAIVGSL